MLSRELARKRRVHPSVIPVCLRIDGPLDREALRNALGAIVERHPALRTSFAHNPALSPAQVAQHLREYAQTRIVPAGVFLQTVLPAVPVNLAGHDLAPLSASARWQELHRLMEEELRRDADHLVPPRMRPLLFRLAPDDHVLLLVLDHLVCDGWSVRIIERELYHLYLRFSGLSDRRLPLPQASYADFSAWQRDAYETTYFDAALRYWREQWNQFGATRIMPRDFAFAARAPAGPASFASHRWTLDAETAASLRRTAAAHKVTLFMLFLAALALVLRQYTGKPRFPVWTHFSNRVRAETRDAVGYFMNTHIIGLEAPGSSIHELLVQVRRAVLEAAVHQELPLPHLWRTAGWAPRFDDAFILLDFRQGRTPAGAGEPDPPVRLTRVDLGEIALPRLSKLGVYVTDHDPEIEVAAAYASNLFPSFAIGELVQDFRRALTNLCHESPGS